MPGFLRPPHLGWAHPQAEVTAGDMHVPVRSSPCSPQMALRGLPDSWEEEPPRLSDLANSQQSSDDPVPPSQ